MFRLARQQKTIGLLATWFIVVALTADAINVDDLDPHVYVIHDQMDAVDAASGLSVSPPSALPVPHGPSKVRQSKSLPGKNLPVRIVFDEDSPSEAAQPFESSQFAVALNPDEQTVTADDAVCGTSLLLLHCTLLI